MQTITSRGLTVYSVMKVFYCGLALPFLFLGIGAGLAALFESAPPAMDSFLGHLQMYLAAVPAYVYGLILGIMGLITGNEAVTVNVSSELFHGVKGFITMLVCGIASPLVIAFVHGLFVGIGLWLWSLFATITLKFRE